jgi:hypothetical protein
MALHCLQEGLEIALRRRNSKLRAPHTQTSNSVISLGLSQDSF